MTTNWDLDTPEGMENSKRWQTQLVGLIQEGGVWMVPRSLSMYRIYHSRRVAVKFSGGPEPQITRVFLAMGWKVEDFQDPPYRGGGQ
jgi:hypothetical protein